MSLLLLLSSASRSQRFLYDGPGQLQAQLQHAGSDSGRIGIMLKYGEYFMNKPGRNRMDLDSARVYQNRAESLAVHLKLEKWKLKCMEARGNWFIACGNISGGKRMYVQVTEALRRDGNTAGEAQIWMNFGKALPVQREEWLTEKKKAFEIAGALFAKAGKKQPEIESLKEIADVHLNEGQLALAEKELLAVLSAYREIGFKKLHHTYFLLSAVSRLRSDLKKELYYDLAAKRSMLATADTADAAFFLCKLGDCYDDLGMLPNSLQAYQDALYKFHSASDVKYSIVKRIVKVMVAQQRPAKALAFLTSYQRKHKPSNTFEESAMYGAFGECFWAMNELVKAEDAYKKMITLSDRNFRSRFLPVESYVKNYQLICNFYLKTGNYRKAASYMSVLEHTPKTLFSSLMMAQLQLMRFKTDSASGHYYEAIRNYQAYKKINDSVFNASRIKEVAELQLRYDLEAKNKNLQVQANNLQLQRKDILLLTKQNQLEHFQVDRSRFRVNLIAVFTLVLILLLGIGYSRYRLKIKSNRELEIKQAQITAKNEELELLLDENQWLLREVHHRVKNNLQIVISLLNSQSAYLRDEAALNAVMESKMRVQSMSLIHQKLYTCENVSTIFMPEYIRDLVGYLKDSYKSAKNVFIDQDVAPFSLDVSQAVPVGLILNEAISNAFKYAFAKPDGVLSIRLTHQLPYGVELTVSDDGKGLPDGLDIGKIKSFGLKLIKGLTEDLGGTLVIDGSSGTTLTIRFSIEPLLQRKANKSRPAAIAATRV